jgi:hypothetical protein
MNLLTFITDLGLGLVTLAFMEAWIFVTKWGQE